VSDVDVDALLVRASEARKHAYAPYSGFRVGAAVLMPDGRVVTGTNVENASYGLTICAERVAAASAVGASRPTIRDRKIVAVALVGSSKDPTFPCGACRQFLYEFNPAMRVVSETPNGKKRSEWVLRDLLIDGFGPLDLRGSR
jgi:cytidine deaminase